MPDLPYGLLVEFGIENGKNEETILSENSHGIESLTISGTTLELVKGDIAAQDVDAIVNAANSALAGGGGVDGAIHAAGGPGIMAETRLRHKEEGCATGSAVMTGAGRLRARHVIHAVGPIWRGGQKGEDTKLASAYATCLRLATEKNLNSIAFPSLSTGAYCYPLEEAAAIALSTVAKALTDNPTSLRLVRFVLYDNQTLAVYKAALGRLTSQKTAGQ